VVLLLAVTALQTTWLARFTLWDVHIHLPLLTIVSVALLLGPRSGTIYGFFTGLVMGVFTGSNIGSFILSRMAVGGIFGYFERAFSRDNILAPPLCAIGAIVISNLIFFILSPTQFPIVWWLRQTAIAVPLHAIAIWPVHWLIGHFVAPPQRTMFG
jgi:rod shape-determining protein MreD